MASSSRPSNWEIRSSPSAPDWEKSHLGRGTFGWVSLWKNRKTSDTRAVKRFLVPPGISPKDFHRLDGVKKYEAEVRRLMGLSHTHIVRVQNPPPDLLVELEKESKLFQDIFLGKPILCMEYCAGGDVRDLLKKPENLSGLPEEQIRVILDCMCQALSHLHGENIIHRDIKPDNIFIQYVPGNDVPVFKLGDFGFAKHLAQLQESFSTVTGTPIYQAPEVPSPATKQNFTVDYWSVGATAAELCFGTHFLKKHFRDSIHLDFPRDKFPQQHQLSSTFLDLIGIWLRSMLQVNPESRGKVAMPLLRELEAHLDLQCLTTETDCLQWMIKFISLPVLQVMPEMSFIIDQDMSMGVIYTWIASILGVTVGDLTLIGQSHSNDPPFIVPFDSKAVEYEKKFDLHWFNTKSPASWFVPMTPPQVPSPTDYVAETFHCDLNQVWKEVLHYLRKLIARTNCAIKGCDILSSLPDALLDGQGGLPGNVGKILPTVRAASIHMELSVSREVPDHIPQLQFLQCLKSWQGSVMSIYNSPTPSARGIEKDLEGQKELQALTECLLYILEDLPVFGAQMETSYRFWLKQKFPSKMYRECTEPEDLQSVSRHSYEIGGSRLSHPVGVADQKYNIPHANTTQWREAEPEYSGGDQAQEEYGLREEEDPSDDGNSVEGDNSGEDSGWRILVGEDFVRELSQAEQGGEADVLRRSGVAELDSRDSREDGESVTLEGLQGHDQNVADDDEAAFYDHYEPFLDGYDYAGDSDDFFYDYTGDSDDLFYDYALDDDDESSSSSNA